MGRLFLGELFQAADSCRKDSRSQRERVEDAQADVWNVQAFGHRRDADRSSPADSLTAQEARSPKIGDRATRDTEGYQCSPGVSSSAPNSQCGSQEEGSPSQPVCGCGVSGNGERPLSATLHDVVGAGKNRKGGTRVSRSEERRVG